MVQRAEKLGYRSDHRGQGRLEDIDGICHLGRFLDIVITLVEVCGKSDEGGDIKLSWPVRPSHIN